MIFVLEFLRELDLFHRHRERHPLRAEKQDRLAFIGHAGMHNTVVAVISDDALQALVPLAKAHLTHAFAGNPPGSKTMKGLAKALGRAVVDEIHKCVAKGALLLKA